MSSIIPSSKTKKYNTVNLCEDRLANCPLLPVAYCHTLLTSHISKDHPSVLTRFVLCFRMILMLHGRCSLIIVHWMLNTRISLSNSQLGRKLYQLCKVSVVWSVLCKQERCLCFTALQTFSSAQPF